MRSRKNEENARRRCLKVVLVFLGGGIDKGVVNEAILMEYSFFYDFWNNFFSNRVVYEIVNKRE